MPSTLKSPLPRPLGTALLALVAALSIVPAAFASKDVVFGVASTFTTLDPYDANDTLSLSAGKAMYQGLVGFDANMKVVNVLAESVEVSKNNLEYTFKLRKGVKFHDGTEFKADAVKAVLDRVTNPDNKLKRFNLFNRVAKTDIINDSTVKITLKEPFSAFLNSMAHPSAMMISPTALKKYGNKEIAFHPVGTGPYQFVEWKATDYLKVKKFDGYWKKGLPKVDSLTFKPVIDNNTRSSVLQTGEAHFVYPVPYEQIELLKTKPNLQVVSSPSILTRYIALNQLQKPFDNLKVRQALNYAVNKEALAKIAFSGQAVSASGVVPQGVDFAVKKAPWPYDPAKARQLLKEAGYPNGFETELWASHNHSTAQKVIQFVQQQLAQVGVKAKLTALEAGQRVEKVESAPKPESAPVRMYYSGWSSSTGEADWALRPLLASESFPPKLFNIAYYKNPAVDSAIAAALTTNDRKEKEKQYAIAQDAVWADAPWIFLVNEKLIFAHSKQLTGVTLLPDASFAFEEMDLAAGK